MLHRALLIFDDAQYFTLHSSSYRFLRIVKNQFYIIISYYFIHTIIIYIKILSLQMDLINFWVLIVASSAIFSFRWKNCLASLDWSGWIWDPLYIYRYGICIMYTVSYIYILCTIGWLGVLCMHTICSIYVYTIYYILHVCCYSLHVRSAVNTFI